jgi:exopolysaccharide biosynthesis polyprenyl glycosylphosphotransferase
MREVGIRAHEELHRTSESQGVSPTEAVERDGALKRPTLVPRAPARPQLPGFRAAVFRRLLVVADLAAASAGLALIATSNGHGMPLASVLSVPLIVVLAKLSGRYDHDEVVLRKSTLDEAPQLLVLAAAFALAWSAVAFLAGVHLELGGAGVVALWATVGGFLLLLRTCARALAQLSAPPERALVVGPSDERDRLAHSLRCDPGAHVEVVGFLPLEDERRRSESRGAGNRRRRSLSFDDLEQLVYELDVSRVFLLASGTDSETMLDAVKRTSQTGVKVSIVPRLFEVVGSAVEFDVVGGVTVLGVRQPGLGRSSSLVKRVMDLVGATLGVLILAPFGLLVAALIKLESPGPVFFRQPRVGKDGKTFQMIKFRTMVDGAHSQQSALAELNETHGLFKITDDPRVTGIGKLLRRTSLDELPQFLNVLKGEMSLVGPRPLVIHEDELIEGRHRDRQNLTPGMTGVWQVLGPPRPPLAEMVKADYLYATNWSPWEDTKIILRTLAHVAARRGR